MRKRLHTWFHTLPLTDPVEQRQAGVVQILLIVIIISSLLGLITSIVTGNPSRNMTVGLIAYPTIAILTSISLWQLRRGQFSVAMYGTIIALELAIGPSFIVAGLRASGGVMLSFAVPIVLAGLSLGRKGLVIATGISITFVLITALLSISGSTLTGFLPPTTPTPLGVLSTFILIVVVLAVCLDQFSGSFHTAFSEAFHRQKELELLRASLEKTVFERTASLEASLSEGEQRAKELADTLHELRSSQALVRELSAPVLPVLKGVLVAPLVGAIDAAKANMLAQNTLAKVEQERARVVIFDVTGVPLVDTQVAQTLIQTATAVRLLGAQAYLVGVRPEVAQTLVSLGVDLNSIPTYADLREAITQLALKA